MFLLRKKYVNLTAIMLNKNAIKIPDPVKLTIPVHAKKGVQVPFFVRGEHPDPKIKNFGSEAPEP